MGVSDPAHDLYLARLTAKAVEQGRFRALEWWSSRDWRPSESNSQPVIRGAATEASVQRDPRGAGFVEINSQGFGGQMTEVLNRMHPLYSGTFSYHPIFLPPRQFLPCCV